MLEVVLGTPKLTKNSLSSSSFILFWQIRATAVLDDFQGLMMGLEGTTL